MLWKFPLKCSGGKKYKIVLNINAVVKYKFLKLHMILKLLSTTALQTNKYRKSSKNINLKEAISACGKIPEK